MNDEENKNGQETYQKVLEDVRQSKLVGKNEAQIAEELSTVYEQEDIQKALEALKYMQAPNTGVTSTAPTNSSAVPIVNNKKEYVQLIWAVVCVIIAFEVISYFVSRVFYYLFVYVAPSLFITGQGFATKLNFLGSLIIELVSATLTFLMLKKYFGPAAFTVLLTIMILKFLSYALFVIYT